MMYFLGFGAIAFILSVVFTDPVTALPFGLDEPFLFLVSTMNQLANTAPWLATILNVFIIGLTVKVLLWLFDKGLWFISLVRG